MTTLPPEDPISAASAGLLALGVPAQRRVETLGLLSALIDLADARGEVLLDSALIATEERLGIDACLEGYEWLERLGVIRRTWSGWVIGNFDVHHGPAAMTAASLAVLRRHLAVTHEPELAPVVTLKRRRRRLPVVAASVAAGVALLAGASQFVPQAAVTGRNAALHTNATDSIGGEVDAVTSPAPAVTGAARTAPTDAVTQPTAPALTTTTSTTLLPGVPCLSDAVNDLTTRGKLKLGSRATVLPPGMLPCP